MIKQTIAALLALLLASGLSACGQPEKTRYEAQFLTLFDTVTTVIAYTDSKELFTAQVQTLHDRLLEYHQLYDIYNDYEGVSNIKTINDQAGIAPVPVDRKIIDLLLLAKKMYQETDGRINVAFGSVLSIWHDYRERGLDDPANAELPPPEKLRAASAHTEIDRVVIDEAASTVFLQDPELRLDVGSIGKGYAVERVCRAAEADGLISALVSVGGNVRAIGGKDAKGAKWNVGVQNPDAASGKKLLETVWLNDCSLVTSGDYQRYYTVNGVNYHHIIDPETLMPAAYFRAVAIICPDSGMADALSTAVFNMPADEGLAFIEALPGTEAVWVDFDGGVRHSSGFGAYLKK